ncbi:farnesylcysteine lyase [Punica granatum]|uniref:Prenylcysteine lyase domain-containing protein n=2 Tax=Punica granatum TaxID=22663 RepID=A0A218WU30_PUNGR|nr:farnesylcysteine lyase [Punica granatum]OWM76357.1 hypothetical protein CDL15_Pgr028227 [Punica granatum]PKI34176.1 hypothetical protein CRG98_045455 [Punica granatum]
MAGDSPLALLLLLLFFLFALCISSLALSSSPQSDPLSVCIVGAGIGGSSAAHFLRQYSPAPFAGPPTLRIRVFERNPVVGGRMARVKIDGDTFEAGGSILHPKNYHVLNYTKLIGLKIKWPNSSKAGDGDDDDGSFGIWDGKKFVFKTWSVPNTKKLPFVDKVVSFANALQLFFRYGLSLIRMNSFTESTVNKFLKYYESFETRPVFETVDDMLKWAGLYNLTTRTLEEELVDAGLCPALIKELITVITRVNYGQSSRISGLAGAVSMAGAGDNLWQVEGGNWQMASGLLNVSDISLHLSEEIESISKLGNYYELNSTKGNSYKCEVTIVATPLDELSIRFDPPVSIPPRKLQHTHATFVRGLLNPAYFGLGSAADIPHLVGTIEEPGLPFSSISILTRHSEKDATYKVFSRQTMGDALLDQIFSVRQETIRIDWGAYPHYQAPEVFAPFILDGRHLYYINAFENAASTMETSAVAAENVARLILTRLFGKVDHSVSMSSDASASDIRLHSDL